MLIVTSTLIVRSKNALSAERAVEEALDFLNTNENLEQVETSLKEQAGVNVTTCKVTETGSNEGSCIRETTYCF